MPFAAATSPTRSGGSVDDEPTAGVRDGRARGREEPAQPLVGAAHERGALGAGEHLGHRGVLHEHAAVDDHDVVDGLRHLGEHVARHEDRAPLRRERPKEVAEPADARGSSPFAGSSRTSTSGSPSSAVASPSRCRIPNE